MQPNEMTIDENASGTLTQPIQKYAEITGRVVVVLKSHSAQNKSSTQKDEMRCIVETKEKKRYPCHCSFFTIVQEGDILFAICTLEEDKTGIYKQMLITNKLEPNVFLEIRRMPFVLLGEDKDCMIRLLCAHVPMSHSRAVELFDHLRLKEPHMTVTERLNKTAYLWNQTKQTILLKEYSSFFREEKAKLFFQWWFKNRNLRRLYLFGLTNKDIKQCVEYGYTLDEIYKACIEDPYRLLCFSMEKCKAIFLQQNKECTNEQSIVHLLARKLSDTVHKRKSMCIPLEEFLQLLPSSLPLEQKQYYIEQMKQNYKVQEENIETKRMLYPWQEYIMETTIFDRFLELQQMGDLCLFKGNIAIEDHYLNEDQSRSIIGALTHPITIINGSAGCGKTKTCSELTKQLEKSNKKYQIGAFTGKAASRIREILQGRKASTIHRMVLELQHLPKEEEFDYMIFDEASMITLELLYLVFRTFRWKFRLVFIGDRNQLPPIGGIGIFDQMIKSKKFPIYTLSINYRTQSENGNVNGIIWNSEELLKHTNSNSSFMWRGFSNFFLHRNGDLSLVQWIVRSLANKGAASTDVTVITPYNSHLKSINIICQNVFLPQAEGVIDSQGTIWKVGDRVMMIENNYQINIFNGEEGIVQQVSPQAIQVAFKDGLVHSFSLQISTSTTSVPSSVDTIEPEVKEQQEISASLLQLKQKNEDPEEQVLSVSHLVHSYALTVHRSQGSEWPYVLIFVPENKANTVFLTQSLVYTAITRAKTILWYIGALEISTKKEETNPSYDTMATRFQRYLP